MIQNINFHHFFSYVFRSDTGNRQEPLDLSRLIEEDAQEKDYLNALEQGRPLEGDFISYCSEAFIHPSHQEPGAGTLNGVQTPQQQLFSIKDIARIVTCTASVFAPLLIGLQYERERNSFRETIKNLYEIPSTIGMHGHGSICNFSQNITSLEPSKLQGMLKAGLDQLLGDAKDHLYEPSLLPSLRIPLLMTSSLVLLFVGLTWLPAPDASLKESAPSQLSSDTKRRAAASSHSLSIQQSFIS